MALALTACGTGAVAGEPISVPGAVAGPSSVDTSATTTTATSTTTTSVAASKPASPKPATGTARPSPTGFPTAATTGVRPGTALTVVNGDQTFSTPGAVVEGKDFHGFVKVTAANITFRNCVFRGRAPGGNAALLDAEHATNLVVEDSEFAAANPAATLDGIWAASTSIYRANVHGTVDGVKADSNVLVQDSYIHDMSWFASDPNQGGGETHNDGVQTFAGESHVTLRHNTIDMSTTKRPNAALQNSTSDTHVENNYLDGGACMLNFDHKSVGRPLTGLFVVNNRFGRHSSYQCPIILSTQSTISQNLGNVWADTGQPIPPPQVHD